VLSREVREGREGGDSEGTRVKVSQISLRKASTNPRDSVCTSEGEVEKVTGDGVWLAVIGSTILSLATIISEGRLGGSDIPPQRCVVTKDCQYLGRNDCSLN
jgi:hypothetical protein